MGKPIRDFTNNTHYFITFKTYLAHFYLKPTQEVNGIIGGCIAYMLQKYPEYKLHAQVFLSNHAHMIISTPDVQFDALSKGTGFMKNQISKRIKEVLNIEGSFYENKPFDAAPILDEASLVDRLAYMRAHGPKEGLTASHDKWPGIKNYPDGHERNNIEYTFHEKTLDIYHKHKIKIEPFCGCTPEKSKALIKQADSLKYERYILRDNPRLTFLGIKKVLNKKHTDRPKVIKKKPRVKCYAETIEQVQTYVRKYKAYVESLRTSYDFLKKEWGPKYCDNQIMQLPGFSFNKLCSKDYG